MKFNISFKTPEKKTSKLLLIALELMIISISFEINLGITPYDFQLIPLFVTLLGMYVWKRHFIKSDNIYPIEMCDDNRGFFLLSTMVISFLLIALFNVPLSPSVMSEQNQFIATVIIAPIAEEIIFRHYMLGRLSEVYGDDNKGVFMAVIISSLIFSLGHSYQGMIGVIMALLKGVIFSGLYLIFKRNLTVSTLTHALHNLLVSI